MNRFILIMLLPVLLAGCGGVSKVAKPFTLPGTKHCAKTKLGVTVFPSIANDFVASTATKGAIRLHLAANEVTLVFAADEQEAANLADAYRRFHAENVGIEDVLRTNRNVVLLWQFHPASGDEANVNDCLE